MTPADFPRTDGWTQTHERRDGAWAKLDAA